jgi:hypothetical protein
MGIIAWIILGLPLASRLSRSRGPRDASPHGLLKPTRRRELPAARVTSGRLFSFRPPRLHECRFG